jgi:hypothetical protein
MAKSTQGRRSRNRPTGESAVPEVPEIWKLLLQLRHDWRAAGIADEDVPPAMADFLMYNVLAMTVSNGLSEMAGEAIIARMRTVLEEFRNREPPFEGVPVQT